MWNAAALVAPPLQINPVLENLMGVLNFLCKLFSEDDDFAL